jgi:hypothetical protein
MMILKSGHWFSVRIMLRQKTNLRELMRDVQ